MIILHPASLHITAASSLVFIPPVPRPVLLSPAMERMDESTLRTSGTSLASLFFVGSESYNPATSERITRRSASVLLATIADSVSLSPNLISVIQTASFSLKIGITPFSNKELMVLLRLIALSLSEYVSRVIKT